MSTEADGTMEARPKKALVQQLEDKEIQEILKSGTDLRQYSKEIEKDLKEVENQSIEEYIKESQNIASLHNQVGDCDNILECMESMLTNFQNALSSISSEITTLQRKSVSMSVQLANRQAVRVQLSQFNEDVEIPEEMINVIMQSPVTDKEFSVQLNNLNHKVNLIKELQFKEAKSCDEVKDTLEKLKIKAMAKIRVYLVEQTYKFRKPMANYQIPENAMLKNKLFFEFILYNERQVAQEICSEYVDTMSKIYYSHFKSYSSRLAALKLEDPVTKDNLMGTDQSSANKGIFSKSTALRTKGTIFEPKF